jgi:transcriptional regulator with XRE-family HTH domain
MDNIAIGERIQRARKRADLNQGELAEKLGFSQSQLSSYEHGNVKGITLDTLEAIARHTQTPVQEFLPDVPLQEITLAEVLRRDYPDMDAGTIRTLETMARFLYEEHRKAHRQDKRRSGKRVTLHSGDSTETVA